MIKFRQPLDVGLARITQVGAPTAADDAATKAYVDAAASASSTPVVLARVALSGPTATATTWTARTMPSASGWKSAAYGAGVFVAAATTSGTSVATSPDGITWTARSLPVATALIDVTYGGGLFVAVADGNTNKAFTSPDGYTWTQRTLPTGQWSGVCYGNGLYVAVTYSAVAATSPDGITWTQRTLPSSASWMAVTYANGLYVTVANSGSIAATSPDGITWTQRTMPTLDYRDIAFGNGVFVALGDSSQCATSPDGITWTARTMATNGGYGLAYGNGLFVTARVNSTQAQVSVNGITWTARTMPSASYWFGVAYGAGVFVVTGNATTNAATGSGSAPAAAQLLYTSPAGITTVIRDLAVAYAGSVSGAEVTVTVGGVALLSSAIVASAAAPLILSADVVLAPGETITAFATQAGFAVHATGTQVA